MKSAQIFSSTNVRHCCHLKGQSQGQIGRTENVQIVIVWQWFEMSSPILTVRQILGHQIKTPLGAYDAPQNF